MDEILKENQNLKGQIDQLREELRNQKLKLMVDELLLKAIETSKECNL